MDFPVSYLQTIRITRLFIYSIPLGAGLAAGRRKPSHSIKYIGLNECVLFFTKLAYPLGKLNARVLALLLSLSLLSRSIEIGPIR